jgi:peptide/nickel transport system substrate-binding protein
MYLKHAFTALVVAAAVASPLPVIAADTIRIATEYPTNTLDPMRSAAAGNIETYGLLYARLVKVDEKGVVGPALAQSWEASPDQLTYTFTLRDAKFSDGSPITAEDVAFSLNRIRTDERSAYPAPLSAVEDIAAKDAKTVVFKLKSPFAPFLGNLDIWNMGIVSKKDVDARTEEKAFTTDPLASGPYMVKEWRPNDRLILTANPHYWRSGYPKTPNVEVIEVTEAQTRLNMLRAGEVEVVRRVPFALVEEAKQDPNIEVRLEPSTTIYVVLLNTRREPFSNVKARQAAAMALDRQAIAKVITLGHTRVANTTMPDALYFHDPSYPGIPHDVEKAKALLAESGMSGREIILLVAAGDAANDQQAAMLQAQWAPIGLNAKIVKVDQSAWWDATGKGEYDAAPSWWFNETLDPDLAVRWALCGACGSHSFNTYYDNPKVNELTEAGAREQDPAKREAIYREIARISTEEVSQIPMYYSPNTNAYSKRVRDLRLTPALQWTLEEATVE